MKRLVLPLLVLILIMGIYAYLRSEVYQLTDKDLSVIQSADKIGMQFVAEKRLQSNVFISNFKEYVEKQDNEQSRNWLQRAKQVQTLTSDLIEKSQDIRVQWLTNPEANNTKLLTDFAKAQKEYVSKLRSVSETSYIPALLTSEQNEQAISEEEFVAMLLEVPLETKLYTLTAIHAAISSRESEAIYAISQKVNYPIFRLTNLLSVVNPKRLVLTEGDIYEASMKLVGVSSQMQPELEVLDSLNEISSLNKEEQNGIINISFMVSANDFDERGLAKKEWVGKLKVKLPDGKDSVLVFRESYIVRRKRDGQSSRPTPTEINPEDDPVDYEEPTIIE